MKELAMRNCLSETVSVRLAQCNWRSATGVIRIKKPFQFVFRKSTSIPLFRCQKPIRLFWIGFFLSCTKNLQKLCLM